MTCEPLLKTGIQGRSQPPPPPVTHTTFREYRLFLSFFLVFFFCSILSGPIRRCDRFFPADMLREDAPYLRGNWGRAQAVKYLRVPDVFFIFLLYFWQGCRNERR